MKQRTGRTGHSRRTHAQHRRLFPWVLLLLLLSLVLVAAPPALAQSPVPDAPSPIDMTVRVGYDGSYRVAQWYPVHVVISNDGPDVRGMLEWGNTMQDGAVFRQEIDLPRGARKQVVLYGLANSFVRTGELRLLENEQVLVRRQVRLDPIEADMFVVGILSSDATLLNSLLSMQLADTTGTEVVHLDPDLLPAHATALLGINAIFIHDIATADLSDEQRAALEQWVQLGGQLLVGGGSSAEQTVPGVADWLPVEVGALQPDVSLAPLNTVLVGRTSSVLDALSSTVNEVTLKPRAEELDTNQLLTTWAYGDGDVVFAAFDLAVLRGWQEEPTLWQEVLRLDAPLAPAGAFRWQANNLLTDVLELPELQLPPLIVLLLFIIGYIVIVGPLNFLVLRRLKRSDMAWLTIPAIVLLFVLGTYGTGILLRGVRPQVLQLSVVQGVEDSERAYATSFVGIFSPRRATYDIALPAETLVSAWRFGGFNDEQMHIFWADDATRLDNILIDVSNLRTVAAEHTLSLPLQVDSSLRIDGMRVVGSVRNVGDQPLRDVLIVQNESFTELGTLAPGASREVSFHRRLTDFPDRVDIENTSAFDRAQMLRSLFSTRSFTAAFGPFPNPMDARALDSEGVYLLAWEEQPATSLLLNGAAVDQNALTLSIIRLDV